MKNKLDRILLSFLLGTSVLLGLAFWLNTIFSFNLFFKEHWNELSRLQASHIPISNGFYISIGVAVFIFVFGLYIIYMPIIKKIQKKQKAVIQPNPILSPQSTNSKSNQKTEDIPIEIIGTVTPRPPRLNLPVNMAEIAAHHHQEQSAPQQKTIQNINYSQNPYNQMLSQIFSDNGYLVKPNPTFSGFTPNLFAIGHGEILWIGAVDQDIEKLHKAIEKLQSVFQETLEDIQINIKAFMLDTMGQYQSKDSIYIFKSTDELKNFISENATDANNDSDQESFDAYSEYIDTIIQYIKNI